MGRAAWVAVLGLVGCAPAPPWETGYLEVTDEGCDGGLIWLTHDPETYRALTCEGELAVVYLSLDAQVVDETGLAALQDHFRYVNLWLYDVGRSRGRSTVYWSNRDPIEELVFDELEGDRLRWSMRVWVDEVTHERRSNRPRCSTGDIRGECHTSEEVDRPVDLDFDLSLDPAPIGG